MKLFPTGLKTVVSKHMNSKDVTLSVLEKGIVQFDSNPILQTAILDIISKMFMVRDQRPKAF